MVVVQLAVEDEARLARFASELNQTEAELVGKWVAQGLERTEMAWRVENFSTLSDADRKELSDWTGNYATDAQLFMLDAEDGEYDWGPNGPPVDDR